LELRDLTRVLHGWLKRDGAIVELTVDKSSVWAAVTRGPEYKKLKNPLLEAIAREWLVKTQQAGKGLTGAVLICKLWRSAIAL
jgi:hypothetical protein